MFKTILLFLVSGSLRAITYELSSEPKLKQLRLVPGNKLCRQCQAKVNSIRNDDSNIINVMDVDNGDLNNNNVIEPEILEIKEEVYLEEDKKALNDMFSTIGMSPIKTKGLHDSGKVNLGKRKMSTLVDIVKFKVAKIFKLPVESLDENKMKTEITEKI